MGVDLIEANGRTSDEGKATDLFPAGASQYLGIAEHAIEAIEETDGVITFKYRGGNEEPDTAIDNVVLNQEVIAIYNILGQLQSTTNMLDLPRGCYIIKTHQGCKKILR